MDLRESITTLLMALGFGLLIFALLPTDLRLRIAVAVGMISTASFGSGYLASYYYSRGENQQ